MKRSPGDAEQERLFSASKFSAEGFLGSDTRTVDEIVAEDAAALAASGVTCKEVADVLRTLFDKAEAALGVSVTISSTVSVTHDEARGKIPSPFKGEGVFQKGEVAIAIASRENPLFITRLGINLIEKHCFFQGKGSRYRIEPADAVLLVRG